MVQIKKISLKKNTCIDGDAKHLLHLPLPHNHVLR